MQRCWEGFKWLTCAHTHTHTQMYEHSVTTAHPYKDSRDHTQPTTTHTHSKHTQKQRCMPQRHRCALIDQLTRPHTHTNTHTRNQIHTPGPACCIRHHCPEKASIHAVRTLTWHALTVYITGPLRDPSLNNYLQTGPRHVPHSIPSTCNTMAT